jgi:DNA-binding NarL/FixJ family response regulator
MILSRNVSHSALTVAVLVLLCGRGHHGCMERESASRDWTISVLRTRGLSVEVIAEKLKLTPGAVRRAAARLDAVKRKGKRSR